MLIAGWGKEAMALGFVGIVKCTHCRNYSPMSVYEIARRIRLYFVPVGKLQRRWYVVCPICSAGSEIDEAARDQLLRESISLPDEATTIAIWNYIDAHVAKVRGDEVTSVSNQLLEVVASASARFGDQPTAYVADWYLRWLSDDDRAQ